MTTHPHFDACHIDSIADALIHAVCADEAAHMIRTRLTLDAKAAVAHATYFDVLFKRLGPYERRWKSMLRSLWADEMAIILANLKKLKGAKARKGLADNILYAQTPFRNRLSKETRALLQTMLADLGQDKLDELDMHIAFEVSNPHVQEWLKDYSFKFSENLEAVSSDRLRTILEAGMEAGRGIPELMHDVREAFDFMNRYRAEIISRTETSRASNQAAIEAYEQSGVVEQKQWLTAPDCCDICAELDNEIVPLDDTFFDDDYGDGTAPPRHPNCRCAVAAYVE